MSDYLDMVLLHSHFHCKLSPFPCEDVFFPVLLNLTRILSFDRSFVYIVGEGGCVIFC